MRNYSSFRLYVSYFAINTHTHTDKKGINSNTDYLEHNFLYYFTLMLYWS